MTNAEDTLSSTYNLKECYHARIAVRDTMSEDELIEEHYRKVLQHIIEDMGDCLDCGICCKFPTVGVTQKDIKRMARYLDLSEGAFKRNHVASIKGRQVLINGNDGCTFLTADNECLVYPERPYPCWTFPFNVQLKTGVVEIRYIEMCPKATHFFFGFLEFIKQYYPATYASVKKTLDENPAKEGEFSACVTLPSVLITQYMLWVLLEGKDGY